MCIYIERERECVCVRERKKQMCIYIYIHIDTEKDMKQGFCYSLERINISSGGSCLSVNMVVANKIHHGVRPEESCSQALKP